MKTTLLSAAAVLALAACGGEVTGGGVGSDTDPERIEDRSAVLAESELAEDGELETQTRLGQPYDGQEIDPDDPRAEDYPALGQETTRLPIEPGNEEPGGKDLMLADEYEAMGYEVPESARLALETAREDAVEPVVVYDGRTYLSYAGLSADGLIGAVAYGPDGEAVADIRDLVLTPDGALSFLVLEDSGPLGLTGSSYTLGADRVAFASSPDSEPRVRTGLTYEEAEDFAEFEEDALPPEAIRATDLLDEEIALSDGGDSAMVTDLLMDTDGQLRMVAVDLNGEQFALPFADLNVAQGAGGYYAETTPQALRAEPVYVGEPAYLASEE